MSVAKPHLLYARQPIYDASLRLAGFELLFRNSDAYETAPVDFDGNVATSQVLVHAFSGGNIDAICSYTPAFVNFTAQTLLSELPFSSDKLVVEVLESVSATEEVVDALLYLRDSGYRIALDDYDTPNADNPILGYVDIAKLDFPKFSESTFPATVSAIREKHPGLSILAEKIETWEDFERCRKLGCDLFQGYFLARPQPVHGKQMPVSQIRVVRLLAALNDPDSDIDKIADIIRNDPFLSLRLLELSNSAFYYSKVKLTSLKSAIIALGTVQIRAFASLLALSRLESKPQALHQIAASRGFICQILCENLTPGPEMGFTVGLFSCLDALCDGSIEEILNRIPFSSEITNALLDYEGVLGLILHTVVQHERGEFGHIDWTDLEAMGIGPNEFMEAFERGVAFATTECNLTD